MPIRPKFPKDTVSEDSAELMPMPSSAGTADMSEVSDGKKSHSAPGPECERQPKQKKQPTGDYPEGYCRPPVKNRFDGTRPGPGRPKGSVSQDTLLRKYLDKRLPARIDGKQRNIAQRELALILRFKQALEERKKDALDFVLRESARLFPDATPRDGGQVMQPEQLDAHDQAILDALRDALRDETE